MNRAGALAAGSMECVGLRAALCAGRVVTVLFSFNAPRGRFNLVWQGFTLENRRHPLRDCRAHSRRSSPASAWPWRRPLLAVLLGGLMALALGRAPGARQSLDRAAAGPAAHQPGDRAGHSAAEPVRGHRSTAWTPHPAAVPQPVLPQLCGTDPQGPAGRVRFQPWNWQPRILGHHRWRPSAGSPCRCWRRESWRPPCSPSRRSTTMSCSSFTAGET